jgi:hypothetical protein
VIDVLVDVQSNVHRAIVSHAGLRGEKCRGYGPAIPLRLWQMLTRVQLTRWASHCHGSHTDLLLSMLWTCIVQINEVVSVLRWLFN